ncbi:MAG: K(+)-transporting ATPase subunit C [Candidatus Aminicenantales bacterium]
MKNWVKELSRSLAAVLSLAVMVGLLYPAAVWVLGQGLFPAKANGSLVRRNGTILGSSLIGQNFAGPAYFHPRPSAAGQGYDAAGSGGSNLGPLSKKLADTIRRRLADYRAENILDPQAPVPADAVTASASGLDPHISLKNALIQAARVAKARGLSETAVRRLVMIHIQGRDLGLLGEPRVNVLMLNLALEGRSK